MRMKASLLKLLKIHAHFWSLKVRFVYDHVVLRGSQPFLDPHFQTF